MQERERQPYAQAPAPKEQSRKANIDKTGRYFDRSLQGLNSLLRDLAQEPRNLPYQNMLQATQAEVAHFLQSLVLMSHQKQVELIEKKLNAIYTEFKAKAQYANLTLPEATLKRIKDSLKLRPEQIENFSALQAVKFLMANLKRATVLHTQEVRLYDQQHRQKKPIDIKALNLKPTDKNQFRKKPTKFDEMYKEGSSREFNLTDCEATLIISETSVHMKKWDSAGVDSYARVIIEQANRQDWNPTYLHGSLQQILALSGALREQGMNKPVRITAKTIQEFQNERIGYIHQSSYPFPFNVFNGFSAASLFGLVRLIDFTGIIEGIFFNPNSLSPFDLQKKHVFLNLAIINNTPHPAMTKFIDDGTAPNLKDPVVKVAAIIENIHQKHGDQPFNTITLTECAQSVIGQELGSDAKTNAELINRYVKLCNRLEQGPMKMHSEAFRALLPAHHHGAFIQAYEQSKEKQKTAQDVAEEHPDHVPSL